MNEGQETSRGKEQPLQQNLLGELNISVKQKLDPYLTRHKDELKIVQQLKSKVKCLGEYIPSWVGLCNGTLDMTKILARKIKVYWISPNAKPCMLKGITEKVEKGQPEEWKQFACFISDMLNI